ncbi:MAG: hypothetical protein CMH95_02755 [Oceanospirillaceae bacterium]|nr:hypothetical protein [Oceanospirillaceae bacterium]
MAMRAYKVQDIVVFASRGTEAKLLAAPELRPAEEWREDVAAWVALRAERAPELDDKVDPVQSTPYIFQP